MNNSDINSVVFSNMYSFQILYVCQITNCKNSSSGTTASKYILNCKIIFTFCLSIINFKTTNKAGSVFNL